MQVAREVERPAHGARHRRPHVHPLRNHADHVDAFVAGQAVEARRLALAQPVHRDAHVVPALGQQPHRRVVVAEIFGRGEREHDLQTPGRASGPLLCAPRPRGRRRCDSASGSIALRTKRAGQPGAPRDRRRRRRVRFDGLDETVRGGHVEAVRPHKRLDERPRLLIARGLPPHGVGQLRQVLRHRRRGREQPAVDVLEMLEVQRPFLLPGELVRQHGVHRPADDARLDQRARVHADDRDAVEHRVEVVGARLGVDRVRPAARPDAHRVVLGRIEVLPLIRVLRMRANENRRAPQHRIGRGADRFDPAPHERHLVRRDERRRAEIQQQRPIVRHADLRAERLARERRLLHEPVVVRLRAGHGHALGRNPVQLAGLRRAAPRSRRSRDPAARESAPSSSGGPSCRRRAPCGCRAPSRRARSPPAASRNRAAASRAAGRAARREGTASMRWPCGTARSSVRTSARRTAEAPGASASAANARGATPTRAPATRRGREDWASGRTADRDSASSRA